jgi:hypothetical protein
VTTNHYNAVTNLHTLQISAENIKSYMSLLDVARQWLPTVDIPLLHCLCSYQLATVSQLCRVQSSKSLLVLASTVILYCSP